MKKILCILTFLFAGSANAAVIFDEATAGADVGSLISTAQSISISDSSVSIKGRLYNYTDDSYDINDVDMFVFNWSGGLFDASVSSNFDPMLYLFDASSSTLVTFNDDAVSPLLNPSDPALYLDLLAGQYGLAIVSWENEPCDNTSICGSSAGQGLQNWSNGGDSAGDYTITINTVAVPEPSIIALFGLGLLGLGFTRQRRFTL